LAPGQDSEQQQGRLVIFRAADAVSSRQAADHLHRAVIQIAVKVRKTLTVAGIVCAVLACCAALALAAAPAIADVRAGSSMAEGVTSAGVWGSAEEVPGLASLKVGDAEVTSVSCPSPGSCVAVGFYFDVAHDVVAFLVSQRGGQWQTAMTVPGLDALRGLRGSAASVVSCSSAGNCVVGGQYSDLSTATQVFVVTERGGVWGNAWGNARAIPGLKALWTC
jgi:hypothetical protein